jgi:hypothetical protein
MGGSSSGTFLNLKVERAALNLRCNRDPATGNSADAELLPEACGTLPAVSSHPVPPRRPGPAEPADLLPTDRER